MKKTIISVLLASIGVGLSGCSTLLEANKSVQENKVVANDLMQQTRKNAGPGAVEIFQGQRFSGEEISIVKKESLPPIFDRPFLYATRSAPPREVIRSISLRTGIPAITQENFTSGGSGSSGAMPAIGAGQTSGQTSLLSIFSGGPITEKPMEIEWDRSLKSLLDYVAVTIGQYWKYEDGRIHFFKEETRSFSINLPHGKKDVEASISLSSGSTTSGASGGGGGGSGSGSSGSSVSVSSTQEIDPFSAITNGVRAIAGEVAALNAGSQGATPGAPGGVPGGMPGMASPGGASQVQGGSTSSNNVRIVSSPELGMITVTASPPALDRVAEYIENVNKKFSRNILIDVTVYNVSLAKESMAGVSFDINRLLMRKFGEIGAAVTSPSMLNPISGATPGQLLLERTGTGNSTSSATLVAQAMGGIGDVSLVRRGQVVAINGQPSPLQVGSSITYLASSSTTQVDGAGATTTLTPGQAIVGMTANFLPTITSDNRILLQYQLNISNLVSIDQVASGGSVIQTPNISQQSLQQQAFLRDGQSLVLFGYDQDQATQNANTSFAGISKNAEKSRQMTVIVMQVHTGGIN